MTENPLRTKKQRKALVYKHGAESPPFYAERELREVVYFSRTGLDIAEAMATALSSHYSASFALERWRAWKRGER